MKHRAKVTDNTGYLKAESEFEFLCDAVLYCHDNSEGSDHCLVVEVIKSLTGYEEYGTIVEWDYEKEYVG